MLTIVIDGPTDITGEWVLERQGSGRLTGFIQDGKTVLNLHPGYADHNLYLRGTLEGDFYSGEWSWVTFPGVTASGTFRARRT